MEIERIEKGGPIAMADITIINDGDQSHLYRNLQSLSAEILQQLYPFTPARL